MDVILSRGVGCTEVVRAGHRWRGHAGCRRRGAVEIEVGALQRVRRVVLGEPANERADRARRSATTRPPIDSNHCRASSIDARPCRRRRTTRRQPVAVHVVELAAADAGPGTSWRRRAAQVGWMSPAASPGSAGRRSAPSPTPAAIASSRAAASAASGTQITLPSSIENSIAARARSAAAPSRSCRAALRRRRSVEHQVELPRQVRGVAQGRSTCPGPRTAA